MKLARPYLIFLNPLYWLATVLRNAFFDIGLIHSTYFEEPVIAIGNLSTGGTGKTPHTEYLIRILKNDYRLAMLSRGYGRKSAGFQEAGKIPLASLVGDEPAQIKRKFPDITVAVDANRVNGIKELLAKQSKPEVILLDDAFQHRKLQAGFYVLLTPYHQLYTRDTLLPAGNLRETKSGADRANVIIVTKCPTGLSKADQDAVIEELKPQSHQEVYFTGIKYGEVVGDLPGWQTPFLLTTGIAKADELLNYLHSKQATFKHLNYKDHHDFSEADVSTMINEAKNLGTSHLLTTEKDFQRLPLERLQKVGIQVSYIPIEINFLEREAAFQRSITEYISAYNQTL